MTMHLSVYNESDPHWRGFPDVYTPKLQLFRRQGPCGMEYIDNLDVVTTWKGLPSSDIAKELLFWENALQNAIYNTVEAWLVEKMKSKGIELNLDGKSTLPPREINHLISCMSGWSDRTVPCKLQSLVNEILLEHESSGQSHPWLLNHEAEDLHIALENFIHTHPCFRHTTSTRYMRVSFASQAVNGHLQIFATIKMRPHLLRIDHSTFPAGIAFDQPILDSATPLYRTDFEVSPDFYQQDVYHCLVRTYFPEEVIFERLFRFIAYLFPARDTPEYIPDWLVEARRTAQELKEDLYRVEGLPTKLREVSINSTRVQNAANEPENPPTYENDIFVGKTTVADTSVFEEIAGCKQGQITTDDAQRSILDEYMVDTALEEDHDDEDMSFVGPDSPEVIVRQMEELREKYTRLELQLKASLDTTTSGLMGISLDGSGATE